MRNLHLLTKKRGFFFWKEADLEAYTNLANQKVNARFQMYSILFSGQRVREVEDIEVPAMRGGKGKKKYYVFVIQPEKLLQGVAYVHRREENNPEQIKNLIDDSEVKIRAFIIQELKKIHGKKWFKKGIPGGIQSYIKDVINKDITKAPYRRYELLSLLPEKKLTRASTSHLREIIISGNNWQHFENTFAKDKECTSVQFKFFETIRNKYKHPEREEEIDEIEKGLGYYGVKWIRRCIGLDRIYN